MNLRQTFERDAVSDKDPFRGTSEISFLGIRQDRSPEAAASKAFQDSEGALFQRRALRAAGTLAWSFDMTLESFRFAGVDDGSGQGSAHLESSVLDLASLSGELSLEDLALRFEAGEGTRLKTMLQSFGVLKSRDGTGTEQLQCILRLKEQGLFFFKGRKVSRTLVLGTVTAMSEDMRRVIRSPGGSETVGVRSESQDFLTGLYSRQGFLTAARKMLMRDGDYDLVVADYNRFRRLNEALGHERADMVLGVLAQRLRDTFGDETVLARLGEDEFAVLTLRGFPRVSERMRMALERTISVAGFDIHPTFSMGAVSVEGGDAALDSSELVRRAEMAVEAAQAKGVGEVASYKRDLESDGLTRLALEAELRKAFISGEIHAWFQPIVTLETGVIAGFEALARWVHPKRGIIPPDHFLGVTRDLGMMADLGMIILNSTVKLIGKWRQAYCLPEGFFVSVNLSASEIERPRLVEDISRLINDAKLPPKCLKLEVTESDVMQDPVAAACVLEALRKAGAGIAMDDFGTGFSSLSYLAKLPFDTLKIDRSFVSTLKTDEASEKIVRAILTLGRDFGLDVVAEGVEDADLAEHLRVLGCGLGQGWGFAKALRPIDAEAFLADSLGQVRD